MMQKSTRVPSKYSETVKKKIEYLIEHGIPVRFEKGIFKTSDCIVDGETIFIINKSLTNEQVILFLDKFITSLDAN
jgi:hypothetical protein